MQENTGCYVAPSATVTGDVTLSPECSVWHGAVVRGDEAPITIGAGTNIQDNAVVHVSVDRPVEIGEGVTVGHGAILHGCTIGDNSLVGMGAIVLDGAEVGANCIVGAGALVSGGRRIPDGNVVLGSPARVARLMGDKDIEGNRANAKMYMEMARESLPARVLPSSVEVPALTIRPATSADISDLLRLLLQVAQVHADGRPDLFMSGGSKYTAPELEEILAEPTKPVFVATGEDDEVLGYAFCIVENYAGDTVRTPIQTLYIDDLCVDAAARGKHVGSALYEYVVDFARKQGCHNITLNVWSCNEGAQRFYESLGMTPYKIGMEQVL